MLFSEKDSFQPRRIDIMFNQIKLLQKFLALVLLAIVMFAVPAWILVDRILQEKSFATKEKPGIDYSMETIKLMQLKIGRASCRERV